MNAVGVFSRNALRARPSTRQLVRSDLYHFENDHGKNLPFKTTNKVGLAIKMVAFLGLGFAAPFLGCKWQFYKAAA